MLIKLITIQLPVAQKVTNSNSKAGKGQSCLSPWKSIVDIFKHGAYRRAFRVLILVCTQFDFFPSSLPVDCAISTCLFADQLAWLNSVISHFTELTNPWRCLTVHITCRRYRLYIRDVFVCLSQLKGQPGDPRFFCE